MESKNKTVEWGKIAEVLLVMLITPTLAFFLFASVWHYFLWWGYYFIITLFLIQACYSFLQLYKGAFRSQFRVGPRKPSGPPPKTTFIVSAYLPNEIDVVEDTLLNILRKVDRPQAGLEVVLAYNTPQFETIETRLKQLAFEYPELVLVNGYNSKSKAENLNYALEIASGEMIALLDADHLVAKDCLARAWRWLDTRDYDVVQGRCAIRNATDNWITRLVDAEFEVIYGLMHPAKSLLYDGALFGGSNGYWRASVIKSVKFDKDMLTEDIDATLRAILSGAKFVHDRSIIATELAPRTAAALWYQRKRWAQGWFECSKYQLAALRSGCLTAKQKFMWTMLLSWRLVYDVLTHFLFPIVFAFWLTQAKVFFPMSPYVYTAVSLTLLSGPFEALAAYRLASSPDKKPWHYVFYAVMAFPYTLFKNTIQVVAIRDEIVGNRNWIISSRA